MSCVTRASRYIVYKVFMFVSNSKYFLEFYYLFFRIIYIPEVKRKIKYMLDPFSAMLIWVFLLENITRRGNAVISMNKL